MLAALNDAQRRVIDTLAGVITSLTLPHPTRVGIDGHSAAGKTTLAGALAEAVQARGREVLRSSLDDCHRPGHKTVRSAVSGRRALL